MSATGAELDLLDSRLPVDPSREDFVAAWHDEDSRATWAKAALALAYEGRHGDLKRYAADVDVPYGTMKHYRSVAGAYEIEKFGRPNISFKAAAALMALEDRFELASSEEPWTAAEARELAAERARTALPPAQPRPGRPRKPPSAQPSLSKAELARAARPETAAQQVVPRSPAAPAPEPVTEPDPAPDPEPVQCTGCAGLEQALADRASDLEAAHRRVRMLDEENTALNERIRALEEANRRLAARLSAAPDRAHPADPGGPQTAETAGDGEPCDGCKGPGASPAWSLQGSTRSEHHVCDRCLEAARRKYPGVVFSRDELLGVAPERAYVPSGDWDAL